MNVNKHHIEKEQYVIKRYYTKKGVNRSKREVYYDKDLANSRYKLLKGLDNTIKLETHIEKVRVRVKDPISATRAFSILLEKFPGKYKSLSDFPTRIVKTNKGFNESLKGGWYCRKPIYYIPELGIEFIHYDIR